MRRDKFFDMWVPVHGNYVAEGLVNHNTGIGKGRQAAALIRYALMMDKIPIFFTADPKLFSDMWGDLNDIHTRVKPFIMGDPSKASIIDTQGNTIVRSPEKKAQDRIMQGILANGWDPEKYNAIFATYSQINDRNARQLFLEQLAATEPTILIMDESHLAAGDATTSMQAAFFVGGPIERGSGSNKHTITMPGLLHANGTKQGMGGVVHLSATFAKRPQNMPVYWRTGLGRAARSFDQLVDAMKRGGVALQQAVSEALAKSAQYLRRERDFSGTTYDMKQVAVADQAKLIEDIDSVTDALGQIVGFSHALADAVRRQQSQIASTAMSQNSIDMNEFAAIVHNQIKQLLLAAKADDVVDAILGSKAKGEKPLIALTNTMETFLDNYCEDHGIKNGSPIKIRWNELIKYALSRTLRAKQTMPNGDSIIVIVDPAEFGLDGRYKEIQDLADSLVVPYPISPLDWIIQKAAKKGLKMAELTGRTSGINYTNFETGEGVYRTFPQANKNTVVNGFNDGTFDGMLLNTGVGFSAHASVKFKDQQPRHMFVVQPHDDINVFVQTLGRIKRTGMVLLGTNEKGQKYGARYTHMVLPLNAEKRPAAMSAKKMKSLNANTTAEADNAVKIDAEDIFNRYGDAIVSEFLDNHPELQQLLNLPIELKADGSIDVKPDVAKKFTGRMALMPDHEQQQAYDAILPAYRELIQQLKATGEYDLEIVVHDDWDGIKKEDQELEAGTDESNIFTSSVRLQKWEVRDTRHVPTGAEMEKEFARKLGSREKVLADWEQVKLKGDAKIQKYRYEVARMQAQYDAEAPHYDTMTPGAKAAHDMLGTRIAQYEALIPGMMDRWDTAKDMGDHVLSSAGQVVEIQNRDTGDAWEGMLTDVRFPTTRFTATALRFRFLLHAPGGVAYVNGGHIGPDEWTVDPSNSEAEDLGPGDKNARYERFVVTGNPFSAYHATAGRGKMVRFKSKEGDLITGLLMPRNWGPQQLVNDPRLNLQSGRAVGHFLNDYGMAGNRGIPLESGQVVRIIREGWGSRSYTITVARKARNIFQDQELRRITGDFTQVSGKFRAQVTDTDIAAAADRIMALTKEPFRPVPTGPVRTEDLITQVSDSNRKGQRSIEEPESVTGVPGEAKGLEAIRRLFEDPAVALSPEARRVGLALLDEPVMRDLDWSRLEVAVRQSLPGGGSGLANPARMLIELARGARPVTFPHEVFHFLWSLLPDSVRAEVNGYRLEELGQAVSMASDMGLPPEVLTLLTDMRKGMDSDTFLGRLAEVTEPRAQALLKELYYLSSPQEYLSGIAGQDYARSSFYHREQSFFERVLERSKGWLNGLLTALKRLVGIKPGINAVIDELLAGKYRSTPETGAEAERAYRDIAPQEDQDDLGTTGADLELDEPGMTTRRMGLVDRILRREAITPAFRAAGKAHAAATFAQAGLQIVEAQDGLWELMDPEFESEIEGQRLLKSVRDQLSQQQTAAAGQATGELAHLLNSIRLHMIDDDVTAFSPTLREELYAVTQGEASHRGLMLQALNFPKTMAYVARNAKTMLLRTYSDAFGGEFVRKVLQRVATSFRDWFTDDEIEEALSKNPATVEFYDRAMWLNRVHEANRVFRKAQYLLKPKQAKRLSQLLGDTRVQEAVNEILQQLKSQGIEPKKRPGAPLPPLEQMLHLIEPKNAAKVQEELERAIAAAEREAGTKQALIEAGTPEERQELSDRFSAGEDPTPEQVEKGLSTPEYEHWKVFRDTMLDYSPVTLALVQKLLRSDFKGTRFGQPIPRPADTRVDLEKLAKDPKAEVERALEAYISDTEASLNLSNATDETKQRVLSQIETELVNQLRLARARVRAPLFQPTSARGVALTPEQRMGQLLNAGLFSDPRLDLQEYVDRIAAKSPVNKLTPKMLDLVKQVFDTPFYRQGDLALNFAKALIQRFGMSVDEADRAADVFEKAFNDKFARAKAAAAKRALESLTPQERKVSRAGKPIWRKLLENINAGNFDSGDVLRGIAAAKGWSPPADTAIAKFKALGERLQRKRELTPQEVADAGGDPEKLRKAQSDKDALTEGDRAAIAKEMSATWAKWTRPISWMHPIATRRNIMDASREFVIGNLLTKLGFLFRLPIHVLGVQLTLHTEYRAIAHALLRHQKGDPTPLWKDVANALKAGNLRTLKAMPAALSGARTALAGRGQTRNVDRLTSGIQAFERMGMKADALAAGGKWAQAAVLRLMGMARYSLRFVQAVDNMQGVPAEFAELEHQIESGLREMGLSPAEIAVSKDKVLSGLKEKHVMAMIQAAWRLEWSDQEFSERKLSEAAWDLVHSQIYDDIRALGLPADDFRSKNEKLRRVLAWQERVIHGPGGVVAEAGRLASKLFPWAMPFANAIGTSINYSLMNTPLYWATQFPVRGNEPSPWWDTPEDRTQRHIQAFFGTLAGLAFMALVWAGLITVRLFWPKDKEERELWEAGGHRPRTLEINVGGGKFIPISLSVGPGNIVAPYAAAAGAIADLVNERTQAQQKLDEEARKKGLTPGKIRPVNSLDYLAVAAKAVWSTIVSGSTAAGFVQSHGEFDVPNISKGVASYASMPILGLPAYQEVSRMMGVTMDPKLATFWDFMLPLPNSGARMLNMLGDPVGTPDATQRTIQTILAGTYPWVVDSNALKNSTAYAALLNSGYRPPSIEVSKGYAIDGEFRPFTDQEVQQYAQARGAALKEALSAVGPGADAGMAKAAYEQANEQALQQMGVDTSAMRAAGTADRAGGGIPAGSPSRYQGSALPAGAPAPRAGAAGATRARSMARVRGLRTGIPRAMRGIRAGPSLRHGAPRAPATRPAIRGVPSGRSLRPRFGR